MHQGPHQGLRPVLLQVQVRAGAQRGVEEKEEAEGEEEEEEAGAVALPSRQRALRLLLPK